MAPSDNSIPTIDINQAEDIVEIIDSSFDGMIDPDSEPKLAEALQHETADSGAFRSKLSDLRKYGLLEGHGEKELNDRAYLLLENKQAAIAKIIEDFPIFEAARREHGSSILDESEWNEVVHDHDTELANEEVIEHAREIYNGLVGHLPDDKPSEPFPEEYFERYYAGLKEESKRSLCLEALEDLSHRPIPDIEYFDSILELVKDETYPEHQDRLLQILSNMCHTSTDTIHSEKRAEATVEKAMDLATSSNESTREKAITILKALDPPQTEETDPADVWDIAQKLAREAKAEDDEKKLKHARQLFTRLVNEWADQELLEQMEEDTFEDYTEDDDYGKFVGHWHEQCRDALDLRPF